MEKARRDSKAMMQKAQEASDDMVAKAEEKAKALVSEDQITKTATAKANEMLTSARHQSQEMLENAQAKAREATETAQARATALLEDAQTKSKDMVETAQAKAALLILPIQRPPSRRFVQIASRKATILSVLPLAFCPATCYNQFRIYLKIFASISHFIAGPPIRPYPAYGWGDGEWMRTWESDCDSAGVNLVCESVICTETPDDAALEACRALGKALVE